MKSVLLWRCTSTYFRYYGLHKSLKDVPLFTFKNGQPLTRRSCLKYLCSVLAAAGYQPLTFNTHSFRICAAISAAQAGIPTSDVGTAQSTVTHAQGRKPSNLVFSLRQNMKHYPYWLWFVNQGNKQCIHVTNIRIILWQSNLWHFLANNILRIWSMLHIYLL